MRKQHKAMYRQVCGRCGRPGHNARSHGPKRNPAGTEILLAFARPAAAAAAAEFGKEFYKRTKQTVKKAARKGKKRR